MRSDGLVCCCGTGAFASSGTCAWMSGSGIQASPPRHANTEVRWLAGAWCTRSVRPVVVVSSADTRLHPPYRPERNEACLLSTSTPAERPAPRPLEPSAHRPARAAYRCGGDPRGGRARARRLRRGRLVDAHVRVLGARRDRRREPADGDRGHASARSRERSTSRTGNGSTRQADAPQCRGGQGGGRMVRRRLRRRELPDAPLPRRVHVVHRRRPGRTRRSRRS